MEDEPRFDVQAVSDHLATTGQLLVQDVERMWAVLVELANGFDAQGQRQLCRAAGDLASRCLRVRDAA